MTVARLLTVVDVMGGDGRRISLSARHEAVLADGRRIVLLDDRGWTEEVRVLAEHPSRERAHAEPPGIWAHATAESIERTARVVVGPDEPFGSRTQVEMEADHWSSLTGILLQHGVEVGAAELRALPHDVELSGRVLARAGVRRH